MTDKAHISKHISAICEVLEARGPMGVSALCDLVDIERTTMSKQCRRAVGLGLMTVENGLGNQYNYSVFSVRPDWREKTGRPKSKSMWGGISSIFQMGAV